MTYSELMNRDMLIDDGGMGYEPNDYLFDSVRGKKLPKLPTILSDN